MITETTIWKDIPGYEGFYKVSNDGQIMRLWKNHYRMVGIPVASKGYCIVILSVDNKQKTISLHRIVAEVFVPNPESKLQVNHINGIKTDNRAENLEWSTASENIIHAHKLGLISYNGNTGKKGEAHHNSKITEDIVLQIREMSTKMKTKDIARQFNLRYELVLNVVNRVTWRHITDNKINIAHR